MNKKTGMVPVFFKFVELIKIGWSLPIVAGIQVTNFLYNQKKNLPSSENLKQAKKEKDREMSDH